MTEKESLNKNIVLKEASRNFLIIFLFYKAA